MKFTKKISLAVIAILLLMSLASCQDDGDGIEVTEEQFIQACKDGNAELVEKALKKNKKLANLKNEHDTPVLALVSERKYKDIVGLLLEKGADVNAKDKDGRSALYWAFTINYGEIDKEILDLLIAKGANLKAADENGHTILMSASRSGFKDIVELAIKKGADVNATDFYGSTALMSAAARGHKDIVELLIKKKADINAKTEGGDTALNNAAGRGNKEVVELLIANGADVNSNGVYGTPLLYACGSQKYFDETHGFKVGDCVLSNDIVKLLISKGADVNARDKNGASALVYAAVNGELEIVKTLVENKANLNIKYDTGENAAIKLAQMGGYTEVVQFLKQALANSPANYIRVNNWKEVKLKQKEFIGKKIAIRTEYMGLSFDGIEIDLNLDGMVGCRFDKKLVDKIISLRDFSYYTFYGTVKEGNWINHVVLYIEAIE